MAEERTYWQIIPYTDRLNYCSSFMNGHGWALAVEKLLDVPAPPRAEAIRVILSEFSRIMDHIIAVSTNVVDLGAITPYFVMLRAREDIYELLEACCGARLTVSYVRIGGLAQDVPEDFEARCRKALASVREVWDAGNELLTRNIVFQKRFKDVGVMDRDEALSWGWVGPCLRGSGVAYDVRRAFPYLKYPELDFEVITKKDGDVFARYQQRIAEMHESIKLATQCLERIAPTGPYAVDDPKVTPPPKDKVYTEMEALIQHFLLYSQGFTVPAGMASVPIEGPRGEQTFTVVSDGTNRPWRVKSRAPSLLACQALPMMCAGALIADVIAIIGSTDIVLGDVDR
jgi:NADH:ubiquinone oxidoreductase subunit D